MDQAFGGRVRALLSCLWWPLGHGLPLGAAGSSPPEGSGSGSLSTALWLQTQEGNTGELIGDFWGLLICKSPDPEHL